MKNMKERRREGKKEKLARMEVGRKCIRRRKKERPKSEEELKKENLTRKLEK